MAIINATSTPYNLVNLTNNENIVEFIRGVNDLTGTLFMTLMLLAGFIIFFFTMREFGNQDALIASMFMTSIIAIFFFSLKFVTGTILTVTIIAFAIAFVFILLRRQ